MKQDYFISYDGTKLVRYEFDCQNPKAIVQIAHGMQEYSATYFPFAQFLSDNGYKVVLFDQRGHGKSVKPEHLGMVNKEEKNQTTMPSDYDLSLIREDIFRQTVADHILMTKILKNEYNLPVYFIGHSYGSFIGQAYLEECPDADKIVLIGSGYMKKPLIHIAKGVSKVVKAFKGVDSKATLVETLSFKAYAKKFKNGSWITSDIQETSKFYSDPLNATSFSSGFYSSMFTNQLKHPNTSALKKVSKSRPVLIASGQDDVIGDMGKGVKKLYEVYKQSGLNVSLKIYEHMRHAILQETNKQEVFDDLLYFLNKNV